MALGQEIVIESQPKGKWDAGTISGTPKPGTCLEIVPGTLAVNGRFTWRAVSRNDGAKGPIAVLVNDFNQGKLSTDAYVSGEFAPNIYWPIAGEELNMLLRYQPGTGTVNSETVGDLLEVDGASGKLQAVGTGGPTGTHASAPFMLLEHLGVSAGADSLVWVKYLGNLA